MKMVTVAQWLGISEEEFDKRVIWGTCIKCGQKAKDKHSSLCPKHSKVFHAYETRQKKKGDKVIV